jgi:hypothetical protein
MLFRRFFALVKVLLSGLRPFALRSLMRTVFLVLGLLNLGNGLWMLLAPAGWYRGLPAGVPDTGPLNVHFVRDIGAAFTTIGVAFLVAGDPARRAVAPALVARAGLTDVPRSSMRRVRGADGRRPTIGACGTRS